MTALPPLPRRPASGHKGTFGTVTIVGGSRSTTAAMIGAPALAALAALRAGAGLAKLLTPDSILPAALAICPSATGLALPESNGTLDMAGSIQAFDSALASATSLVIGPGLGLGDVQRALSLRAVQQDSLPVVVDADALNNLAEIPDLFRDFHAPAILTPHPGEFKRLAASLRIPHDPINPASRPAAAAALAQRLACICILKGQHTVVSNGLDTWTCTHGHACLATAGTGAVLAGLLAGLLAQFAQGPTPALPLFDLARIAVEAHALAGEAWAQTHTSEAGLIATELADLLPQTLERFRA